MKSNKLFNQNEMADLLSQIKTDDFQETEMTKEMKASQRRYEEIIKKHNDSNQE